MCGELVLALAILPVGLRLQGEPLRLPAPRFATNTVWATNTLAEWRVSCNGWNGLQAELNHRTVLAQVEHSWTNFSNFKLEETKLQARIGGKAALDAAAFSTEGNLTGFDSGVELRRIRVYAKGDCQFVLPVSYELELGYVPDSFYIENSYLEFKDLRWFDWLGSLKAGQYGVPVGLEPYGSSRDLLLMETATPLQALAPGVNAGLQVGRPWASQRATWALGLFTDSATDDLGDATKGFGRIVGRLTGLPLFEHSDHAPNAQQLLHLGISATVVFAGDNGVRFRSRPESHLAPYVVDTGEIEADGSHTVAGEIAWVHGRFSLQGEVLHSWVREALGQDVRFYGFYGAVSWFLTGESRPYDRKKGTFTRLQPLRPFDPQKGAWGAWELVGRFSHLNLNSGPVEGGRVTMLMAGVNWHLHSHVKWRFDYGFGWLPDRSPEGRLNVFQTRVEVDF